MKHHRERATPKNGHEYGRAVCAALGIDAAEHGVYALELKVSAASVLDVTLHMRPKYEAVKNLGQLADTVAEHVSSVILERNDMVMAVKIGKELDMDKWLDKNGVSKDQWRREKYKYTFRREHD